MPPWRPSTRPSTCTMSPASAAPGLQALDDVGVAALRHEADVLAVGLVGDGQGELARQRAHLGLAIGAEGKHQPIELGARGGEQEVALVALGIAGAAELGAGGPGAQLDVVAGGERVRLELARGRQQLVELDLLVADHTRDRRFAGHIAVGERLHDRRLEALLVVEDVVRRCPAGRRPGGRRGCPARRSRRRAGRRPRRGRRAAG